MNYYICEECRTLYCGWATSKFCQKCRRVLKKITREEFYAEEVVIEGGGKR